GGGGRPTPGSAPVLGPLAAPQLPTPRLHGRQRPNAVPLAFEAVGAIFSPIKELEVVMPGYAVAHLKLLVSDGGTECSESAARSRTEGLLFDFAFIQLARGILPLPNGHGAENEARRFHASALVNRKPGAAEWDFIGQPTVIFQSVVAALAG